MGQALIIYFFSIGGSEVILILLFILIFFGSKGIPEIARGLGKGIREFRNASNSIKSEITQSIRDAERQTNIQKTIGNQIDKNLGIDLNDNSKKD